MALSNLDLGGSFSLVTCGPIYQPPAHIDLLNLHSTNPRGWSPDTRIYMAAGAARVPVGVK